MKIKTSIFISVYLLYGLKSEQIHEEYIRFDRNHQYYNNNHLSITKESCTSSNFKTSFITMLNQLKCKPRPTIIYLDSTLIITPNAVIVKRCHGYCSRQRRCISAQARLKKFHITRLKHDQSECISVEIEEDLKCHCGCLEKTCGVMQTFDATRCRCTCTNNVVKSLCMFKNNSNWDDDRCKCACKEMKTCTTSTVWDNEQCR